VPQESRILSFSKSEVFDALRNYRSHTGGELNEASRNRLVLQSPGEVTVEQSGQKVHFTEPEVAAALILFCASHAIPVARRSSKFLEVVGETLNLRLTIS
jgi:hypothetical protein